MFLKIWDALNEAKDQFQKSASGEMSVAEIDGISLGKTGIILKAAAGGGNELYRRQKSPNFIPHYMYRVYICSHSHYSYF